MNSINKKSFNYSDGINIENNIYKKINSTSNRSYNSTELAKKIKNWAEYYHLSVGRANVIDFLDLPSESSVLEIGSGCGAITRYLGENFKEVIGIEGSATRKEIAVERCKDLTNVHIEHTDLQNFTTSQRFDYIFIIGVLEYAPLYIDISGENNTSCLNFIELCKKFLKPEGAIITAIENKIGLKYWNGAKEDHGQGLYTGLMDYPKKPGPITFSRKELLDLFLRAGLKNNKIYGAMPDYKFATVIFNIDNKINNPFNWVKIESPDPNNKYIRNFNEILTFRSLTKAGLFHEFLNSYIIVSTIDKSESEKTNWNVKCYNLYRNKDLQTILTSDGKYVEKRRVSGDSRPIINKNGFSHLIGKKKIVNGDLLLFKVLDVVYNKDEDDRVIKDYLKSLMNKFHTGKVRDEVPLLSGDSFDYTFSNLIYSNDNFHFIDDEWKFERLFPADYILFRSIHRGIQPYYNIFQEKGSFKQFRMNFIRKYFPRYHKARDNQFVNIEKKIMLLLNSDQIGILKDPYSIKLKNLIKKRTIHIFKKIIKKLV